MKRQYHKEYLTREELTAFLKAKLSSERLEKVRDVFVFSCFTGLVYEDLKKLRAEQLMTLPSGSHYLRIYVPMTRFPRTIPLLDIPYKIIEKYKGQQEDGGLFPLFPLPVMNIRLREIASECGITQRTRMRRASTQRERKAERMRHTARMRKNTTAKTANMGNPPPKPTTTPPTKAHTKRTAT